MSLEYFGDNSMVWKAKLVTPLTLAEFYIGGGGNGGSDRGAGSDCLCSSWESSIHGGHGEAGPPSH